MTPIRVDVLPRPRRAKRALTDEMRVVRSVPDKWYLVAEFQDNNNCYAERMRWRKHGFEVCQRKLEGVIRLYARWDQNNGN